MLFILDAGIGREHHVETGIACGEQQVAVLDALPSHIGHGENIVPGEKVSQVVGEDSRREVASSR